ncbi:hypothetical protein L1D32_04450 [Shewanella insulae]|uniref:hypothetical protein n=1 Tax=Shewanella insulae TaxID=2681496 RepID=UPI001EFCE27D|nr:hypothetical protein [Shewanella insulae]MCG9737410.1 hypothetical protein [Shewanella insulae]
MKPYKNLNSKNLGLLLLVARLTAVIGGGLTLFSILICAALTFTGGLVTASSFFAFIPLSVGVLFLSGLMAALVSFEENFRLRTEHIIGSDGY